ncbi:MAG: chemotaxis protein CheW [Rhodospirillales bacterium]|nr:chemotaxis protein CheW [Rhodospirillales bacterium]
MVKPLQASPAELPCLIFALHETIFAIDARVVLETVWLPDLAQVAEMPPYVIGVFDLRGEIVPVIDLDLRLGREPWPYQLSHCIIVLEFEGRPTGIVVSEIRDMQDLDMGGVISSHARKASRKGEPVHFVIGDVHLGDDIVSVIDHTALLDGETHGKPNARVAKSAPSFFPAATVEEKAVLRRRTHDLAQPLSSEEGTKRIGLAVFELSGERFAVDLQTISGFAEMGPVTPIPCCPAHIGGFMNLRGELLTLIDIRVILSLPIGAFSPMSKIVILREGGAPTGIPVDDIIDLVYISSTDMVETPSALRTLDEEEYVKGALSVDGHAVEILDLPHLLSLQSLIVNSVP